MRTHTISLLKNSLLALVLVAVILPAYHLLIISPAFSRFLMHQMEGNIKVLSNQIADHLRNGARQGLTPNNMPPELAEHLKEFRQYFNLDKIKLVNADGLTVFSSDPDEIGKPHPPMSFAQKLREGESVSSRVKAGRPTLDGDITSTELIETYVPFFSNQKEYLGAVEIYYQSRRQDLTFTWLTNQIGAMFGLLALLMAAITFQLARRQRAFHKGREIAAEQLRLARDQWEQTFNAIEDVITVMDEDFRFVKVNRATTRLFNTTTEALIGRHCYELFSKGTTPCPGCPGLTELKVSKSHTGEVYHPRLDKHLLVSISRINDHAGHLSGFVHVARDITEQKRMETQLRQTQKLEAIGVLTGGVTHNFRNILASIKTSAQVIEMDYADDPKLKEITGWIIDSVDYGSQLVTGLAQFSRLKKSRELQGLELNKIAADAFQILRGSMSRKTELHLVPCPEQLPVMGDAGGLMQVILNICNNASDAINGIGIIRIQLSRTEHCAIIEISDNGPGIDPKIIDKIFEPFFTTKDVDKGTGLGLSTSFGIIRDMGGQILASSKLGEGATFTITLPLLSGVELNQAPAEKPLPPAAVRRILVVDDEPMLIELNRRLLGKIGYEVAGAGGCEEALQLLRDWRPDLVIMDLNMPVRDGFSCADAMYEIDPGVRIILISGSEIEAEGNLDGPRSQYIRAFLNKPVGLADLTAIINRILETPTNPA
jgi:PAS domain S-box-containing protein